MFIPGPLRYEQEFYCKMNTCHFPNPVFGQVIHVCFKTFFWQSFQPVLHKLNNCFIRYNLLLSYNGCNMWSRIILQEHNASSYSVPFFFRLEFKVIPCIDGLLGLQKVHANNTFSISEYCLLQLFWQTVLTLFGGGNPVLLLGFIAFILY